MQTETELSTTTAGLFELVLEVTDLERSERFYREALGLKLANRWGTDPYDDDAREAVFLEIGPHAFLGLWPRETGGENALAGGRGGSHVHFALLVTYGTLDVMQIRLEERGVMVVLEKNFGQGNRAIYINDPDGHVVELTERTTDWAGEPMTSVPVVKGQ